MLTLFFITIMGISLALPFCSSNMILCTSLELQSVMNILLVLDCGINSVKLGMLVIGIPSPLLATSFILVAIEVKYELNALAICLRSVIRSLLMMNCGFIDRWHFPLNWLIIFHVFLLSPW